MDMRMTADRLRGSRASGAADLRLSDTFELIRVQPRSGHSAAARLFVVALFLIASLASSPALTQTLTAPGTSAPVQAEQVPADPFRRETPEQATDGLLEALAARDLDRAAMYLDLSEQPRRSREARGRALAADLQRLLDRQGQVLPRALLSSAPTGALDDGLLPDRERVGALQGGPEPVDLLLRRGLAENGAPIWRVAPETLAAVPKLAAATTTDTPLERLAPVTLQRSELWGAPAADWLALLVLTVAAFLGSILFAEAIRRSWRLLSTGDGSENPRSFVLDAILAPVSLICAVLIVEEAARPLGVGIVARSAYGRLLDLAAWTAIAWLFVRLIDVWANRALGRFRRQHRAQAISVAVFVRRALKAAVLAIGAVAILDTLGFDVTTGLAALGIGGLAFALGAQKTIENLIASVSVLADQPIRVGEFCRIGSATGTVEEIGMRSTRLRTLDQTLLIIPNSEIEASIIENYSRRGRFWLHPVFTVDQKTSPDRLRLVLAGIRAVLEHHPTHPVTGFRATLLPPKAERLPVEVFAVLDADSYDAFLQRQEDLTLDMLDVFAREGVPLAGPVTPSGL